MANFRWFLATLMVVIVAMQEDAQTDHIPLQDISVQTETDNVRDLADFGAQVGSATAPSAPSLTSHVFQIRKRAGGITYGGSCVAIGDDRFATAWHTIRDGNGIVEVEVQPDKWKAVSFTRWVSDHDFAVVTVPGAGVDGVAFRNPEYMEPVTVYGMRSQQLQKGFCSNIYLTPTNAAPAQANASLNIDETGTIQGDSGGAVFGEDGMLVGILTSRNPSEHRVASFTPIGSVMGNIDGVAQSAAKPSQGSKPVNRSGYSSPDCVDGICRQPSPFSQYVSPKLTPAQQRRAARGRL